MYTMYVCTVYYVPSACVTERPGGRRGWCTVMVSLLYSATYTVPTLLYCVRCLCPRHFCIFLYLVRLQE